MFRKEKAQDIARESLRQAQVDLLQSEFYAEHYQSTAIMLQGRIKRLEDYLAQSEPAPPAVSRLPSIARRS